MHNEKVKNEAAREKSPLAVPDWQSLQSALNQAEEVYNADNARAPRSKRPNQLEPPPRPAVDDYQASLETYSFLPPNSLLCSFARSHFSTYFENIS